LVIKNCASACFIRGKDRMPVVGPSLEAAVMNAVAVLFGY
jgi:hypothetical protein